MFTFKLHLSLATLAMLCWCCQHVLKNIEKPNKKITFRDNLNKILEFLILTNLVYH